MAHAYSAIGTCPFNECAVFVLDGCGSPLDHFLQLHPEERQLISSKSLSSLEMQCEQDSFYYYDGQNLKTLHKTFSPLSNPDHTISLPTTRHSIGGFYAVVSKYVFGNMDDVGKLMGLSPYGQRGTFNWSAFHIDSEGSLFVLDDWKEAFTKPFISYENFSNNFQYYANVARWAQDEIEKAVIQILRARIDKFPSSNLCYAGGVALNAVANSKILNSGIVDELYIEPASADNGLALGCAYYGWLEVLKKRRAPHDGNTCFGKVYSHEAIMESTKQLPNASVSYLTYPTEEELTKEVSAFLNKGLTVAWFQQGSEFGPRALGRRSILAHPGFPGLKDHINKNIKFREDFRPFAPAIIDEDVNKYFESSRDSPYMILINKTKKSYLEDLTNVTHIDGTARVQTVVKKWNRRFYQLLRAFEKQSGFPILLNTSFNKKGTPIVETPQEAIELFIETALDVLVIENLVILKR